MISVILQFTGSTGLEMGLIAVFAGMTAIAGLLVASLAYRGYRRNESGPMLYLAVGIAFLTTVPVVIDYTLQGATAASEAEILLVITVSHLAGLGAILFALTKA